jgi:hypothetical protein
MRSPAFVWAATLAMPVVVANAPGVSAGDAGRSHVREESAVQSPETARLNVVMYVGGRKLLSEDGSS